MLEKLKDSFYLLTISAIKISHNKNALQSRIKNKEKQLKTIENS